MSKPSQTRNSEIRADEFAEEFEICSRMAVEALLNRPTLLFKRFRSRTYPLPGGTVCCNVVGHTLDISVEISLAMSDADLRSFLPNETDPEMRKDVIGEILNIISGTLFRRPNFQSKFGHLRASVPSFLGRNTQLQRAHAISGVISMDSLRLIIELVVNSNENGVQA